MRLWRKHILVRSDVELKSYYDTWKKDGVLPEVLDMIKGWRADGAQLDEIAKKLNISRATLFDYQNKYSDFSDALKTGGMIMDGKVEDSLLKECAGYEYEETTTTTTAIIDKKTGRVSSLEKVEKRTTKKYARPSITAIIYYLNNRIPDKWKNRIVTTIEEGQNSEEAILEMESYFADKMKEEAEAETKTEE